MFLQMWIDEKHILMPERISVLQACASIKQQLPFFCYHENLSIAGNCRMCLVEINNNKKLQVACATEVTSGMHVYTNTLRVKKANESVLEFLLINHPLDCPICDQGGECDLQDLTMFFGSDRGRFYEIQKRAVQDKFLGVFIKTVMTRCIHCTRCIRFLQEISGDFSLGSTGRGGSMEITNYINKNVEEELTGNIIDICPVGALTSKPYAFKARPWEAKQIMSVDIFDSVCSNIRIDVFNNKILRILPVSNSFINEDWITNKIRFFYDAINIQRLTTPLINRNCYFFRVSWRKIFKYLNLIIFQRYIDHIECNFSPLTDLISLQLLKDFFNSFGNNNFNSQTNFEMSDFRASYLANISLYELELLNFILLIFTNSRLEFPLFNLRLRKRFLKGNFQIFSFGLGLNYFTFPIKNLGGVCNYFKFIYGYNSLSKILLKIKQSKVFFGKAILKSSFFKSFFSSGFILSSIVNKDDLVGYLENESGLIGAYDLGLFSSINRFIFYRNLKNYMRNDNSFISTFFVLNDVDFLKNIKRSLVNFIVFLGSHGDYSVRKADIILPISSYLEVESIFVNLEGFAQISNIAVGSPGDSRDLHSFLYAFSLYFFLHKNNNSKASSSNVVHNKYDIIKFSFNFILNSISIAERLKQTLPIWFYSKYYIYNFNININTISKVFNNLLDHEIYNFYTNNHITRNSAILTSTKTLRIDTFDDN